MPRNLKKAATLKPEKTYRWCDRKEKYFSIAVCKKKGEIKPSCHRCLIEWQYLRLQLPLPFMEDGF